MVVQCTDQYGDTRFYRAPRWVQRKLGARWGRLTGRWYWWAWPSPPMAPGALRPAPWHPMVGWTDH